MKIILDHSYEDLISIDNLLLAWQEFLKGKRKKKDVQEFQFNLMDNILSLHEDLKNNIYRHGNYYAFKINDPKPRDIYKATVRDRLLHHAVYRILYPFFEKTFIADSFSCRNNKGTHKAINRFRSFAYKASKNNTKTCWVLKCDIKKFFASINNEKLNEILSQRINDKSVLSVLKEVISSFDLKNNKTGLPLGNLTSQLFANVYMNEFDQFVKHKLKIRYYIRYADDFVILSGDRKKLEKLINAIANYLQLHLKLKFNSNKVFIKTLNSGVDFLGWINFFDHRVLRTSTKKRMFKRLKFNSKAETINSYIGLIGHGNASKIKKDVLNMIATKKE